MKPLFYKSLLAVAMLSAAWQAQAVGRVADVQVIDRQTGRAMPTYFHQGEYWVAGQPGAKYAIQIRNSRGPRVLAVTSVDGLNVLSGETADFGQSGYVFESGQRYGIEGWRKSDSEVAAFVFTASGDSYAERIGKPHDMGVIGVALFRERPPVALYSPPVITHRHESPAPSSADLKDKFHESASGAAQAPASKAAPIMREPVPSAAASTPAPAPAAPAAQADASSRKAAPSVERERSAAMPQPMPAPLPSPKLGTAHGEREASIVSRTQFVRNSAQPDEIIRIRYDSVANLMALGIIPSPRTLPAPNPFPANAGYVPDPPAYR
jgi:hypothetical protein